MADLRARLAEEADKTRQLEFEKRSLVTQLTSSNPANQRYQHYQQRLQVERGPELRSSTLAELSARPNNIINAPVVTSSSGYAQTQPP